MGKKSDGGGQTQTTVQKADPWVGVQPNLLQLYGAGGSWFNEGPKVMGSNNMIDQSLALTQRRATQGSSLDRSAQALIEGITSGRYLQGNPVASGHLASQDMIANGQFANTNREAAGMMSNPYLDRMVDASTRDVTRNFRESIAPSLASQFSMAGRTGSGSHVAAFDSAANTLAGKLGDISSNIRGNVYESERNRMASAYEAERQRQAGAYGMQQGARVNMFAQMPEITMRAASMAPGLSSLDFQNIQALQNAGLLQRDIQQQVMDGPLKNLSAYSQILSGAAPYGEQTGSQSAATRNPYNKLTGAIGGGLSGAMLGPLMGLSGGMGALLGGALGLFG